jgi:hypothetical protein
MWVCPVRHVVMETTSSAGVACTPVCTVGQEGGAGAAVWVCAMSTVVSVVKGETHLVSLVCGLRATFGPTQTPNDTTQPCSGGDS